MFPDTITVHKTDYSKASLIKVFRGFDAVVSAVASFSVDQQSNIVDAAVEAGVKRFLPSEYGVDSSVPQYVEHVPWVKAKRDTIAHLRTKENTQLSWTALCVGAWFDSVGNLVWSNPLVSTATYSPFPHTIIALNVALQILKNGGGLLGWDIPAGRATIYDSGDQPYEATNVLQIGRAVAGILKHAEETKNKYIYVNSFTLTQNRVLAVLEKASGKKFEVTRVTTKDTREEALRKAASENMAALLQGATAVIYGYGGLNNFSGNRKLANDMLGLPKESLEETIEEVIREKGVSGQHRSLA